MENDLGKNTKIDEDILKNVHAKFYGNSILVYGEGTKQIKDLLKSLSCIWNNKLQGHICYKDRQFFIETLIGKKVQPADTKTKKEILSDNNKEYIINYINTFTPEKRKYVLAQLVKNFYILDYNTKNLTHKTNKQLSSSEVDMRHPDRPHFKQMIYHIGTINEFTYLCKELLLLNSCIYNTFEYMFNYLKKGIFVYIKDSIIKIYLPFSNVDYRNNYYKLLKVSNEYKQVIRNRIKNESNLRQKEFLEKTNPIVLLELDNQQKFLKRFNKTIEKNVSKWYSNGHMFRNTIYDGSNFNKERRLEYKFDEGDKSVATFLDLISETCLYHYISEAYFFINPRDYPVLKKDRTNPYDPLYTHARNSVLSFNNPLCKIFSQSITDKYDDILFPDEDDIINCLQIETGEIKPYEEVEHIPFDKKINKAVFRGSATGAGIFIHTNRRIQIAYLSKVYPNLIDAKLVGLNERLKKDPSVDYCDYINPDLPAKLEKFDEVYQIKDFYDKSSRLTNQELSLFKYVIDIEGHTSAFRLGRTFSYNSVILKVDSEWKLWFSDYLRIISISDILNGSTEGECIGIPVINGIIDYEGLINVINYLNQHEEQASKIAENGYIFYKKYINREFLLEYTKNIITSN